MQAVRTLTQNNGTENVCNTEKGQAKHKQCRFKLHSNQPCDQSINKTAVWRPITQDKQDAA